MGAFSAGSNINNVSPYEVFATIFSHKRFCFPSRTKSSHSFAKNLALINTAKLETTWSNSERVDTIFQNLPYMAKIHNSINRYKITVQKFLKSSKKVLLEHYPFKFPTIKAFFGVAIKNRPFRRLSYLKYHPS